MKIRRRKRIKKKQINCGGVPSMVNDHMEKRGKKSKTRADPLNWF